MADLKPLPYFTKISVRRHFGLAKCFRRRTKLSLMLMMISSLQDKHDKILRGLIVTQYQVELQQTSITGSRSEISRHTIDNITRQH